MPTLLLFILVFAVLVIIHEGGHFFAARLGGVEVDEFGLGLPPRFLTLWRSKGSIKIDNIVLRIPRNANLPFGRPSLTGSVQGTPFEWQNALNKGVVATYDDSGDGPVLRTLEFVDQSPEPASSGLPYRPREGQTQGSRGVNEIRGVVTDLHPGTAYTLNMLPLGGFVRPRGENDPNVPGGLAAASPWIRLGVLLAGPFMNILAGILIFTVMFMSSGVPDTSRVYLGSVLAGSPAETAGLKTGDVIVSINGSAVKSADQLHNLIYSNLDKPMLVVFMRDGIQQTLSVTPSSKRTASEGAIGVQLANPVQNATFLTALQLGFRVTGSYIHEIITLPARILENQVAAGSARFIGLKGMYDFMNQAVQRDAQSRLEPPVPGPSGTPAQQRPTNYTLALIATLSLSLGIFNLLPIPALDGGRIMFLLPELIFRRRVPPNVENTVHAIGMVTLLLLMLVINVMDFVSPVKIPLP